MNKIQQHYGVTEWHDKAMIRLGSGNQLKHKHRKASLSDQNTATDSVSGGRLLVILQCRPPIWAVERRKKVCFFVFFQFSQTLLNFLAQETVSCGRHTADSCEKCPLVWHICCDSIFIYIFANISDYWIK